MTLAMVLSSGASSGWPWGAILGVAFGAAAAMVVFDTPWRRIPERALAIAAQARRQVRWIVLAAASVGVLVFY
jgi:hypothetical protein